MSLNCLTFTVEHAVLPPDSISPPPQKKTSTNRGAREEGEKGRSKRKREDNVPIVPELSTPVLSDQNSSQEERFMIRKESEKSGEGEILPREVPGREA